MQGEIGASGGLADGGEERHEADAEERFGVGVFEIGAEAPEDAVGAVGEVGVGQLGDFGGALLGVVHGVADGTREAGLEEDKGGDAEGLQVADAGAAVGFDGAAGAEDGHPVDVLEGRFEGGFDIVEGGVFGFEDARVMSMRSRYLPTWVKSQGWPWGMVWSVRPWKSMEPWRTILSISAGDSSKRATASSAWRAQ